MLDLETILNEIDKEFNVKLRKNAKTRKREILLLRYLYFTIAKEKTKYSLDKIGEPLKKDHATVINGLKKYQNLLLLYPNYLEKIAKIRYKINDICASLEDDNFISEEDYKDKDVLINKIQELKKKNILLRSQYKSIKKFNTINRLNVDGKLIKSISKVHESNFDTFLNKLDALCELNQYELKLN